eukprot:4831072-Alexandrium_andersonii.AAC.1
MLHGDIRIMRTDVYQPIQADCKASHEHSGRPSDAHPPGFREFDPTEQVHHDAMHLSDAFPRMLQFGIDDQHAVLPDWIHERYAIHHV